MNLDPRTSLPETEVQKILQLHALADRLLDAFSDAPRVTCVPTPSVGLIVNSRKRKIWALHSDAALPIEENAEEELEPLILEEA